MKWKVRMKFLVCLLFAFAWLGCEESVATRTTSLTPQSSQSSQAVKQHPSATSNKAVAQASTAVVEKASNSVENISGQPYAVQRQKLVAKREKITETHEKINFLQQRLGFLQQSGQSEEFQKAMAEYMSLEAGFEKEYGSYMIMVDNFLKALAQDYETGKLSEQEQLWYAAALGEKQDFPTQIVVLEKLLKSSSMAIQDKMSLAYAYEQTNQLLKSIETLSLVANESKEEPKIQTQLNFMIAQNLFFIENFNEALDMLTSLEGVKEVADSVEHFKQIALDYQKLHELEQQYRAEDKNLPQVEITTNKGRIVLELFEDDAPNAVANFISLTEQGYYNGLRFHRVIPKFMAQGGDPHSKEADSELVGRGFPGYRIKTNLSRRQHFRGVISYANTGLDTDGSQFFLTVVPSFWLNGKHAVFGRVIQGMELVDGIVQNDQMLTVKVLKKRDHEYIVQKIDKL